MKILILGHRGYIGSSLLNFFKQKYEVLTINERLDGNKICLPECNTIINCIGYTGRPNIDAAENDKISCLDLNVNFPLKLAEYTKDKNQHLIHLSSGCIFNSVYTVENINFSSSNSYDVTKISRISETDKPEPESFYSKTKYMAEMLLSSYQHVALPRIRMPLGEIPHPRNLINKLINYSKIINLKNSITSLGFLNLAIEQIILKRAVGIYHLTDMELSPTRIMFEYKRIVDKNHKYEIISIDELNKLTTAKRSNCILDTTQTKKNLNWYFASGQDSSLEELNRILKKYKDNLK